MKFNEKLIELRKKEGLSQEELGYKLNVTRQTVSKWELGQTTPEMDKLVEISRIFNISVDELINETDEATNETINETTAIEDKPIGNESTKEKNTKIIIIGVLVIVIVLILSIVGLNIFNKVKENQKEEKAQEDITDRFYDTYDKTLNVIEQQTQNYNEEEFYNNFDKVLNTMDQTTQEFNEDKTQVDMQNVVSQFEISKFNNSLEIYAGTKMGAAVTHVLDDIITKNKTEDRKITVEYTGTETQDESEIRAIKQKIENFDNYEITFEYDNDGFINKAIIEKV